MGFDMGIAISQGQLDIGAQQIFGRFPELFTGSKQISFSGIEFTATFTVQQAPAFDLTPPAGDPVGDHLRSALGDRVDEETGGLVALAVDAANPFDVEFTDVLLTLTAPNVPPAELTLDITVLCGIAPSGNTVAFVAYDATTAEQQDPFNQLVVETFVVPEVLSAAQQLFQGLGIPTFDMPGISLSPPIAVIDQQRLIVLANVVGNGSPSYDGGTWPPTGFAALLSVTALQAVTSYAVGASPWMDDSGSSGDDAFEAYYHFQMRLVNPQVSIAGDNLSVSFTLVGSMGAGVHVLWVPIELSYSVQSLPNPTAIVRLEPQGNQLVAVEQSITPFTVLVVPDGNIPSKVLSWMTQFIVQGVVGSLTPMITGFLSGIRFTSMTIPTYTETIGSASVTMTPTGLTVGAAGDHLALAGSLSFS